MNSTSLNLEAQQHRTTENTVPTRSNIYNIYNIIKCSLDPWSWKPTTERKVESFDVFLHRWSSSPEKEAQDVGYEQHKAHPGGEALAGATPLNLLVLGNVRQGPTKHHQAGRQPGQARPHVILRLSIHLGWRLSQISAVCHSPWKAAEQTFCMSE